MTTLAARLLAKRMIVGDCWVFNGSLDQCGYGRISVGNVSSLAHRVSWTVFRGDPGAAHVLHNEGCVSRACFNPDHLHLGTHQRNMVERDTWGKGIRGERVSGARLTTQDVLLVRNLRSKGMIWRAIADLFGVHPSTVRHAATGRSWRHV